MTGGYAKKDGSIVISDTAPHALRIADGIATTESVSLCVG
jgi:hypothetical protein